MNYDDIFQAYYNLYRAEAQTPSSSDDEYTIGMRLANEAISQWDGYDNTYWRELFQTYQNSGEATTITEGTTTYDAPSDFKEAGGFARIIDSEGNTVRRYSIIEAQEAQFKIDKGQYCYFTGDPANGYVLNLNPAPDSAIDGFAIDFVYYKTPTQFTAGSDVTEMADPYYIVHRMLANRFRASRNPYYQSAQQDAEDALRVMQLNNNSGTWANPWKLQDNSGAEFGVTAPGSWQW